MKKLSLCILLGGVVYLSGLDAQSTMIKIKNDTSEYISIRAIQGTDIAEGTTLSASVLEPGSAKSVEVTQKPLYIAVWDRVVNSEVVLKKGTKKGLKVAPEPTKLYKTVNPVDMVWKEGKLTPSGNGEVITSIPIK